MSINDVLDALRMNREFMSQVVAWERIPTKAAHYGEELDSIDSRVLAALRQPEEHAPDHQQREEHKSEESGKGGHGCSGLLLRHPRGWGACTVAAGGIFHIS